MITYTNIFQHGHTGPDGMIVLGSVALESRLVHVRMQLTVQDQTQILNLVGVYFSFIYVLMLHAGNNKTENA